jgi:drug/metabolite transporter (DMT)-like permease
LSSSAPTLSTSLPAESTPADPGKGWLLFCLFALYIIWGSTYLAMRWALEGGFPPLRMGGLRFTLAGIILYTVLRLRGTPAPTSRQWMAGAFTGLLMLAIGNGCIAYAQQWVPSGVAALVVGSVPLWAALFGGLYNGQWPKWAERLGLALGFCGIALLNQGGELGSQWLPVIALLLAPMTWSFGSLWGRHSPSMPPGLMATATQMLCAGAMLMGLSTLVGEHMVGLPTARGLGAFLYLVAFGSLIAFSAYGYLLRHARPAVATSYAYVNPMVAVLLGVVLGGETPNANVFLAMTAILTAVVLITRKVHAPVRHEASTPANAPSTS